jgi:hypothetical protein
VIGAVPAGVVERFVKLTVVLPQPEVGLKEKSLSGPALTVTV